MLCMTWQGSALELLKQLKGPKAAKQLREEISPEQLSEWGLSLCLDFSKRAREVQGLECQVTWGGRGP